jgi:anti-anti-sigma regulatory factor
MHATPAHWCLEIDQNGPALAIRFAGRQVRLGEGHLRLADEYLFGPGVQVSGRGVVLDMGNVACLASTALAALVRLHEKVAAAGGRLRLDGVSPHLYELLEVTQTHRLLDVHRSEGIPAADPEPAAAAPSP